MRLFSTETWFITKRRGSYEPVPRKRSRLVGQSLELRAMMDGDPYQNAEDAYNAAISQIMVDYSQDQAAADQTTSDTVIAADAALYSEETADNDSAQQQATNDQQLFDDGVTEADSTEQQASTTPTRRFMQPNRQTPTS